MKSAMFTKWGDVQRRIKRRNMNQNTPAAGHDVKNSVLCRSAVARVCCALREAA